jgi:hypothetical protein
MSTADAGELQCVIPAASLHNMQITPYCITAQAALYQTLFATSILRRTNSSRADVAGKMEEFTCG